MHYAEQEKKAKTRLVDILAKCGAHGLKSIVYKIQYKYKKINALEKAMVRRYNKEKKKEEKARKKRRGMKINIGNNLVEHRLKGGEESALL
ncbi:MAG: hypothetical protein IJF98_07445 [Firmicutes bacterium]|nr:hypothetical protein [Bacillota bacterium]